MWTTAYDTSGQEGDDILTMAGFVARAQDWISFEAEWTARLNRDGLIWYHHADFPTRNMVEAGWKDDPVRCRLLTEDLISIIQRHAHQKFAVTVPRSALAVLPQLLRDNFRLTAYSLAGRSIVTAVNEWLIYRRTPDAPVEHVFAEGDKGKGLLMRRLAEDDWRNVRFRPNRDVRTNRGRSVKGFCALQAADILALEIFRWHKDGNYDAHPILRELDKTVLGNPLTYSLGDAEKMRDMLADSDWLRRFSDFL